MDKVHFKTNALLKNIIGKDLITDDYIAVLELVKNSFDAGSPSVDIVLKNILSNDDSEKLKNPTSHTSKLVIKDIGIGMSGKDIVDKWLNIAYSEKKDNQTQFGRILAGNKGVGRFSCDRLGKLLTIYTKTSSTKYNKLFIDWRLFEKEGDLDFKIQDIELEIDEIEQGELKNHAGYDDFEHGTILEISLLREDWTPDKIVGLRRELEKLINPNQAFTSNPFHIKVKAAEYNQYDQLVDDTKKVNGLIKNRIFEKLDFKTSSIHASLDKEGKVITTTLQDRGYEIFELKEENPFRELSDIKINIYYLNPYAKKYFTRQTGIRSVNFGSIYLFINGFRIPPYGDDGDDWLGMEIRKGQGYNRYLGTREIVGRIEITDFQDKFKIISNRSGIVNNLAFEQLTKSESPFGLYYKIFRRLERFVVDGIKWDKTISNPEKEQDDSEEKYKVDSLTRSKNILSVINSIIDVKKENLISLKINEDFVSSIIEEQAQKASLDLQIILSKLGEKSRDINPEGIASLIEQLDNNSLELRELFNNISAANLGVGLDRLEHVGADISEVQKELTELKARVDEEEKQRIQLEEEKEQLQRELELEKEKNTYLRTSRRDLSDDAKGLVHNIKITSKNISSNVSNLHAKIQNGQIRTNDILRTLGAIKFQSDKALKISNIITRSNFRADKNDQIADIVKYVEQYIAIYRDIYERSQLNFEIINNNAEFTKKISILEISVIIDDLISNSEKAGAKNVRILMDNPMSDSLRLVFSDDGCGVDKLFLDNPSKIFELGVTTTDGSGIGLNSVKAALKRMNADISFVANGVNEMSGATFEVIFRQ